MKAIVSVQKSESSVKHCLKKCKQTSFQVQIRLRGAENLKRWEEGEGGGGRVDCKSMELVAPGWCTRKW